MDSNEKRNKQRFGWPWRWRSKEEVEGSVGSGSVLPKHQNVGHVMKNKAPPVTLVVNYSQDGVENPSTATLLPPPPTAAGHGIATTRPSVSFSTTQVAKPKRRRHAAFGSRLSLHSLFLPVTQAVPAPKDQSRKTRSVHDLDRSGSTVTALNPSEDSSSERGSVTAASSNLRECPLCFARQPTDAFISLTCCSHRQCYSCLVQYLQLEILESRVQISCPECSELLHPSDIYRILADEAQLIDKWEEFSVRRVLLLEPDTRWCPAPNCTYAVIASGCAGCPVIRCERDGCNTYFCYHCKQIWHPNQTCDQARTRRGSFATSPIHLDSTIRPGDIKPCPRCRTFIVKMQDGSCNHMVCAICGAEFCWLCMKEITDLHYLSPSGCTFWGKKPWSRKKKLMWQLGTLVGAPVGIALIAGLAVPAIIFGVPVWVGRKVHQRMRFAKRSHHHLAVASSVLATVVMSPLLASLAIGVGVPIMVAYVYGVVPLSLCRNGTCGVTASSSGLRLETDSDILAMTGFVDGGPANERSSLLLDKDKNDSSTVHSGSTHHRLQIQAEVLYSRRRPSIESGATSLGEKFNYEEASTKGLAGSTYYDDKSMRDAEALSYTGDDGFSTRALAGSVVAADAKSVSAKSCGSAECDVASTQALAGSICDSKSLKSGYGEHLQLVPVDTHAAHDDASNRSLAGSLASDRKSVRGIVIGDGYQLADETVPFLAGKSSGYMGSMGEIAEDSLVEPSAVGLDAYAICENCCRAIESDGNNDGDRGRDRGGPGPSTSSHRPSASSDDDSTLLILPSGALQPSAAGHIRKSRSVSGNVFAPVRSQGNRSMRKTASWMPRLGGNDKRKRSDSSASYSSLPELANDWRDDLHSRIARLERLTNMSLSRISALLR